jgi:apolipoprotein N-acyltransferase
LLSGFLYFLAFPGVDCWPLAFLALVPLIVALEGQTPRRALLLGWVAGLTMTTCGFYWLLDMLQTFSGFPTPLCAVFLVLLCAYQGGRIGVMAWLAARGAAKGYPRGLSFTLAFVASELAYPLVFPWTYAGTVHQLPSLLQVAELGGPIAVAVPLVLANLAFAELVRARLARRRPAAWPLAGLLAPLLAAAYGALRVPQIDARAAASPKASVALIQANMSLFGKREQLDEGLRRHLDLSARARAQGPIDLLVWSETSVMAPIWERDTAQVIPRLVGRWLGAPALFGAVIAKPVDDVRGNVFFNSVLLTDSRGAVVGRYDKRYRLPFGEFLPFGDTFPILYEWSPNSGRFAAGEEPRTLTLGQHQVAAFVCYEDIIPAYVREIARSGDPDLLVNLTNDAWFGDTTEPWIHLALSKFRAIEHRRYFVRSTNSGVSAVIDPAGRVVAHSGTFEEAALRADIHWMRASTLYELWGDLPWWLLSFCSVAFAFLPRRRTSQRKGAPASDTQAPPDSKLPHPVAVSPDFLRNSHEFLLRNRVIETRTSE